MKNEVHTTIKRFYSKGVPDRHFMGKPDTQAVSLSMARVNKNSNHVLRLMAILWIFIHTDILIYVY
jgi:hypothetical protein